MSYLIRYYAAGGDRYHVRLAREEGKRWEHVMSALMTAQEMEAFTEMCRKLDPGTVREQSPTPAPGQGLLPLLGRRGL